MVDQILDLREAFRSEYRDILADIVEFYDPDEYLHSSSVAENLIFGEALKDTYSVEKLPENERFLGFLENAGLTEPLFDLGLELSEAYVQLFDSRASKEDILDTGPIPPDAIDEYKKILYQVKRKHGQKTSEKTRSKISVSYTHLTLPTILLV